MNTYTLIPKNTVIENLSDGAFKLYATLLSYCYGDKDSCFPSQKTLGERLKKSVRTIQRYLKELVSKNLIKIIRRGSTSNMYKILNKITSSNKKKSKKNNKNSLYKNNKRNNKNKFCDFSQRNYDFDKLEKALLGIDKNLTYEDCLTKKGLPGVGKNAR